METYAGIPVDGTIRGRSATTRDALGVIPRDGDGADGIRPAGAPGSDAWDSVKTDSIEARWWFAGSLPGDILDWFRTCAPTHEDHRTDQYLLRSGLDDTGVKRRSGGRLELKLRTSRREAVKLGHGAGHVEWWTKWSLGLHGDHRFIDPLSGPDWVAVEKRRWVLDRGGCAIELAVVTLDGADRWWSLGLEGPAETHGADDLDDVLSHLFVIGPPRPLHLQPTTSRGYAEHLCARRPHLTAPTASVHRTARQAVGVS